MKHAIVFVIFETFVTQDSPMLHSKCVHYIPKRYLLKQNLWSWLPVSYLKTITFTKFCPFFMHTIKQSLLVIHQEEGWFNVIQFLINLTQ